MNVLTFLKPSPMQTFEPDDLDGLALHLADLADEDWRTLTAARKAALRTVAEWARAAAVETKGRA